VLRKALSVLVDGEGPARNPSLPLSLPRCPSVLHRALRLIAAARRELAGALVREGGLPAALWARPELLSRAMRQGEQPLHGGPRQQPVRLRLGFAADPLSYALELG
jgi:predicted ATPase